MLASSSSQFDPEANANLLDREAAIFDAEYTDRLYGRSRAELVNGAAPS
jgi:hypothetical protein